MTRRAKSIVAVVLVAAGWMLANSSWPGVYRSGHLRSGGAAAATISVMDRQAANFSIRAVSQSGLLDTTRTLLDYQRVEPLETGWKAAFAAYDCRSSLTIGRCLPLGDAAVSVAVSDGLFRVTDVEDATGLVPVHKVMSYTEPTPSEEPRFEFPSVQLSHYPDVWALEGSALWTGPIPANPGYVARCQGEVFDRLGKLIAQSKPLSLTPPLKEELRNGGIDPVDLPSFPGDADEFTITCETSLSKGWQPEGQASVGAGEEGLSQVALSLIWVGQESIEIRSLCTASVFDAQGTLVGSGRIDLTGPTTPAGETPHRLPISIATSAPIDRSDHASVGCTPVHQNDPRV
jgi:hypothetical protein